MREPLERVDGEVKRIQPFLDALALLTVRLPATCY
jgi:hypothetical protein